MSITKNRFTLNRYFTQTHNTLSRALAEIQIDIILSLQRTNIFDSPFIERTFLLLSLSHFGSQTLML